MIPADLSSAAGLDSLPDQCLIQTRGGIILQKWNHYTRTNEHAWHRPGYEYSYSTSDLLDQIHQPVKFLMEVTA